MLFSEVSVMSAMMKSAQSGSYLGFVVLPGG